MRVSVFAFGKLKTPGLRDAANYYQGLIRTWITLEEIELKPLSVPDKSPSTRRQVQEKEGALLLERIEKNFGSRVLIYLLDEGGKNLSTQQWAQTVRDWEGGGISEIVICVGSSLGFSEAIRKASRGSFALGPQTLPHELARVVLCEQLYRAWGVTRNHPYHNEGT